MLLYRTDLSTLAPGDEKAQDCYEGDGGSIMSHVRGVLYGSQEPTGMMTLPEGVGFQVASQEILLLQVHYLNASMNELNSKVTVNLHTTSDGSRIHNQAGILFFYDPFIDVPMAQKATANARCTLPEDITLLGVFPHYHARGVAYRAFLDPPSASPASSPFYTSTDWSHPAPWTGGPLHIAAGTAIRWYCIGAIRRRGRAARCTSPPAPPSAGTATTTIRRAPWSTSRGRAPPTMRCACSPAPTIRR
jgi:hypothetical protein